MALIKCAECGKEISDSAERCPNCGCTTKAGKNRGEEKGIAISGLIQAGIMVIGIIQLLKGNLILGVILAIPGFVGLIEMSIKLKKAEKKHAQERVTRREYDPVMKDTPADGLRWKCSCGKTNEAGTWNCANCGRRRTHS